MSEDLRLQIQEDMKNAMRAKDALRLSTIRMLLAAIKQKEIDERGVIITNQDVLTILHKMIKQRRDAASQFDAANREDLASKERAEIILLEAYLPEPLTEDEILTLIKQAIATTQASQAKDMGKIMAILKDQIAGKADMSTVSALVKASLNS